jgi:ammonia channel protein AmtB
MPTRSGRSAAVQFVDADDPSSIRTFPGTFPGIFAGIFAGIFTGIFTGTFAERRHLSAP